MNKMQMAHEYAKTLAANPVVLVLSDEDIVDRAWKYADAMQAEAEKREDKTRPKALLTKDKDGKCLHFNHEFGHKKCMDCGASLEEWQPDWSQAPEWAKWWVKESAGSYWWLQTRPVKEKDFWLHKNRNSKSMFAPSFNYQGKWQDSLRKRPQ